MNSQFTRSELSSSHPTKSYCARAMTLRACERPGWRGDKPTLVAAESRPARPRMSLKGSEISPKCRRNHAGGEGVAPPVSEASNFPPSPLTVERGRNAERHHRRDSQGPAVPADGLRPRDADDDGSARGGRTRRAAQKEKPPSISTRAFPSTHTRHGESKL